MPEDLDADRTPIHQRIVAAIDPHRSRRRYQALRAAFLN
jgi:hypothetical protein